MKYLLYSLCLFLCCSACTWNLDHCDERDDCFFVPADTALCGKFRAIVTLGDFEPYRHLSFYFPERDRLVVVGGNSNKPFLYDTDVLNDQIEPIPVDFTTSGTEAGLVINETQALIFGANESNSKEIWLFDLADNFQFTKVGEMNFSRKFFEVIRVNQDEILIVGGNQDFISPKDSLEIFNINTSESRTLTVALPQNRIAITATALGADCINNGCDVLITGGGDFEGGGSALNDAFIYQNSDESLKTVDGQMQDKRVYHAAVLLDANKGRVLLTGGSDHVNGNIATTSVDIYNHESQSFESIPNNLLLFQPRLFHTMLKTNHPECQVLIMGGLKRNSIDLSNFLAQCEIYQSIDDRALIKPSAVMNFGRYNHTTTLLNDGSTILAVGGNTAGTDDGSGVEKYTVE